MSERGVLQKNKNKKIEKWKNKGEEEQRRQGVFDLRLNGGGICGCNLLPFHDPLALAELCQGEK